MKTLNTFIFLIFLCATARSQSCTIPQSLTEKQRQMVKGNWYGHYELDSAKTQFSVLINFDIPYPVQVSNPPLNGKTAREEYRFCGAGAFHFKMTIESAYYEFDGVPVGNAMQGTLVVLNGDTKRTGKFQLRK